VAEVVVEPQLVGEVLVEHLLMELQELQTRAVEVGVLIHNQV
jgi:hypothetical protein